MRDARLAIQEERYFMRRRFMRVEQVKSTVLNKRKDFLDMGIAV